MTAVEQVIARLESRDLRPKSVGVDKWEARCPAHDDRKASLSIGVGADDRVLLHCHAECPVEDVLAALALTPADLFASNGNGAQEVEEYVYLTADGADFREQGDGEGDEAAPEVQTIRRALFEDSTDVWDASDMIRQEAPGTEGLLHKSVAATLYADRGEGKSSVALAISAAHAEAGGRVAYFDRENSPELNKARVQAIMDANGWPDLRESGRFVCRHYPAIGRGWQGEHIAEAIAGMGFTGVVYDSLREFLGQLGLDPDSEADLTIFFTHFVTPLLQRGLWVLPLDNVGHSEKGRPKGSATKLDACPQGYLVETITKFSPTKAGEIRITCKRSRYGDEGRTWRMPIGGGEFGIPKPDSPAETAKVDSAKRAQAARDERESFRLTAIAALEGEAPLSRDNLKAAMRAAGGKVGRRANELLNDLASDTRSGITHTSRGYQIAEQTLPLRPVTDARDTPPVTDPAVTGRDTPSRDTPQTAPQSHTDLSPHGRDTPVSGQGVTPDTPFRKGVRVTADPLQTRLREISELPEDQRDEAYQQLEDEQRQAATG